MHINLIARTNGVGLDSDTHLLKRALVAMGHKVTVSHSRGRNFLQKCTDLLFDRHDYDVNIFLERVFPNWLNSAPINFLIPNQERYPKRHLKRLEKIDQVLCKSRHAEEIFSAYCSASFLGFTSKDLHLNDEIPDYQRFFHLAGRSTLKGTETLLEVWEKHPEWPTLTLVQHAQNAPKSVPNNVHLISDYLAYDDLIKLVNKSGIHLCPSRSEGWGHYIVEALSCGALVLTTDAPPMNEIITKKHGKLVPFTYEEPRHLGTNFFIDPQQLESSIQHIINMSLAEKKELGRAARAWFLNNNQQFKQRLAKVFDK